MGGIVSIARGIGLASVRMKLVLFLYLGNLAFALVIAAPLVHGLASGTLHLPDLRPDPAGHHALEQPATGGGVPILAWVDLASRLEDPSTGSVAWLRYGSLAFVVFATFLSGGVLSALRAADERVSLSSFLLGCGRYFGRFARLLVVGAVGLVVLQLVNVAAVRGVESIFSGAGEAALETAHAVRTAALVAALLSLLVLLDYARVRIVLEERTSVLLATFGALLFLLRRPFTVAAIQIFFVGAEVVLIAGFVVAASSSFAPQGIALAIAAQQIVVLLRCGLRVACQGAQLHAFGSYATGLLARMEALGLGSPPVADRAAKKGRREAGKEEALAPDGRSAIPLSPARGQEVSPMYPEDEP